MKKHLYDQKGFSLIETMISMLVVAIVLTGLISFSARLQKAVSAQRNQAVLPYNVEVVKALLFNYLTAYQFWVENMPDGCSYAGKYFWRTGFSTLPSQYDRKLEVSTHPYANISQKDKLKAGLEPYLHPRRTTVAAAVVSPIRLTPFMDVSNLSNSNAPSLSNPIGAPPPNDAPGLGTLTGQSLALNNWWTALTAAEKVPTNKLYELVNRCMENNLDPKRAKFIRPSTMLGRAAGVFANNTDFEFCMLMESDSFDPGVMNGNINKTSTAGYTTRSSKDFGFRVIHAKVSLIDIVGNGKQTCTEKLGYYEYEKGSTLLGWKVQMDIGTVDDYTKRASEQMRSFASRGFNVEMKPRAAINCNVDSNVGDAAYVFKCLPLPWIPAVIP